MSKIIKLEDGQLVAEDPDTGERVPVSFEALEAGSVNTENAGRGNGNLWGQGTSWQTTVAGLKDDPDDVSSDSFVTIADFNISGVGGDRIPDGATLYANLFIRCENLPDSETGTYRARMQERSGEDANFIDVSELDIEITEEGRHSSGWTEITAMNWDSNDVVVAHTLDAKVTSGTIETGAAIHNILAFEWRVD